MGNRKSKKESFKWERFIDAKKRAKISIRQLGASEGGVGRSEKTIRRAKSDGEIKPELIEALAKRLDVAPDYLRGEYDCIYEQFADNFTGKQREAYLKTMLAPERFPYYMGRNKTMLYDNYMDGILMLHDISHRQYNELSPEKRRQFQIDIEQAIGSVIKKYFTHDGQGREGIPELYRLEAEIECYDPDEPTEPGDAVSYGFKDRFSEHSNKEK